MDTFRVRNWRKYQRYTDRRPKWISVYTTIREDIEFTAVSAGLPIPTDAEMGQIIGLYCLAARYDDPDQNPDGPDLPMDSAWIQKHANLTSAPDLKRLASLCVIECNKLSQTDTETSHTFGRFCASENSTVQQRRGEESTGFALKRDADTPASPAPDRPEAERLCRQLADAIRDNRPTAKLPEPGTAAWDRWTADMDLMLRRDHRTEQEAASVIAWCQRDDFWKANILSPSKLRKQYDTLALQMRRPAGAAGKRQDVAATNKASLAAVYRVLDGEVEQP